MATAKGCATIYQFLVRTAATTPAIYGGRCDGVNKGGTTTTEWVGTQGEVGKAGIGYIVAIPSRWFYAVNLGRTEPGQASGWHVPVWPGIGTSCSGSPYGVGRVQVSGDDREELEPRGIGGGGGKGSTCVGVNTRGNHSFCYGGGREGSNWAGTGGKLDDIKGDPPKELKVSPVAAIPHKSKDYRSILDLSFRLRLEDGGEVPAVNETSTKTAPGGSIDQIGHSLKRVIHAFTESADNEQIFMAKWDIKDGFWRLQCREGEEWNFAYVLPAAEGSPTQLVVPTPHLHGVGVVVFGESLACPPTVCRMEWPDDIKASLVLFTNPRGTITNSDLEMAGLLLLWLVVEAVCGDLTER